MMLLSLLSIIYIICDYKYGDVVWGWPSIMITIWFIGGMMMVSIGIIGEYVGKIYHEVKHRPRYFIEKIVDGDDEKLMGREFLIEYLRIKNKITHRLWEMSVNNCIPNRWFVCMEFLRCLFVLYVKFVHHNRSFSVATFLGASENFFKAIVGICFNKAFVVMWPY